MADTVERGREAFHRKAWRDAYEYLSAAQEQGDIAADDLDRLGAAAYLIAEDEASVRAWEAAHRAYLDDGRFDEAARCAFWVGLVFMFKGDTAQGGGWLARAARAVEEAGAECAASGYLLIPGFLEALHAGEVATARELAERITDAGHRFGDPDLTALGLVSQGQAALSLGDTKAGSALLDEAMVAVTAGEVAPIAAGIVYCALIDTCVRSWDVRRAAEWTGALTQWCEAQPDLVPYQGQCLVHRSQVLQVHGEWPEAATEAERAQVRLTEPPHPALGLAHYQRGELHRLRGEFAEAEAAYRQANRHGHEPVPGLALLRLAQGDFDTATAAIRRACDEAVEPLARPAMLTAAVEIMRTAGDLDGARAAADQLADIAAHRPVPMLAASAAHARGSVLLAEGDPAAALVELRKAAADWQELGMPYEGARTRVLVGLACAAVGDTATAELEFDAARTCFETLGAQPELDRLTGLVGDGGHGPGLTDREREVLRLVATGKTNRDVAGALVISEHTVARHVQNIFTKLGVSSRAAATAYAYEHDLA